MEYERRFKLERYLGRSWLIKRTVKTKDGSEKWEILCYPGGLEQAASRLLQESIPEEELMTIPEVLAAVKSAEETILAALQDIVTLSSIDRGIRPSTSA